MLSKKNIKKTIVLFTFRRKKAEFLLALFLIASLPLAAGEISDTDVLNAVSSTNLITAIPRKVNIISGSEELPKHPPVKIKPKIKTTARIKRRKPHQKSHLTFIKKLLV